MSATDGPHQSEDPSRPHQREDHKKILLFVCVFSKILFAPNARVQQWKASNTARSRIVRAWCTSYSSSSFWPPEPELLLGGVSTKSSMPADAHDENFSWQEWLSRKKPHHDEVCFCFEKASPLWGHFLIFSNLCDHCWYLFFVFYLHFLWAHQICMTHWRLWGLRHQLHFRLLRSLI